MRARRSIAATLAMAVGITGAALAAGSTPAGADGLTAVPVTCSGIPIIGSTTATADVNATDDVDPVAPGGTVINTINVPVPVQNVPISVTVTEVKLNIPIPAGVTVNSVAFTTSSFPTQTWAVAGGVLTATLKGSVPLGGSAPTPTVPDVSVTTTVAGPARTVEWKVPTSITAKADAGLLGTFTASCTPDTTSTTLISTTVSAVNQAPTATDQAVSTAYQTAKAVTLAGTDPESSPLTFAVDAGPSHGTLTGTAPSLTYTPANGYSGSDSFTFTASDGTLSDTGTVSITVAGPTATAPGAPTIGTATAKAGQVTVTWTPPASDGGSPITGWTLTHLAGGVAQPSITVATPGATSTTVTGLTNGVSHAFTVAAVNAVGTGAASGSASATPQWWMPWSTGTAAVTDLFTWFTGKAPTATELSTWLGQFNAGTKTPGDLVAALRTGTDATANVDPTARLYSAYFVRIPDKSGLEYWVRKRRAGAKLSAMSATFATSSEFKRRYGTLTNRAFVEQIYLNVQGRAGEKTGVDYWSKQLDTKKKSRGQVMLGFSESNEYKRTQVEKLHAALVSIAMRGKAPTVIERDAFVAQLKGGQTLAQVVAGVILADPLLDARAT